MLELLSKIFGSKYERDLKVIKPYVDEIKLQYELLSSISNDELRQKTNVLRKEIVSELKPFQDKQDEVQKNLEENNSIDPIEIEVLQSEVKKCESNKYKQLEEILLKKLPLAFAIMKETARRFSQNEFLEVTANEFDEEIADNNDYVVIRDGKAIWSTTWDVLGHSIKWNMIHYDVQLIGGVILHMGKIAEMATGEGKTLVATLPLFLNSLTGLGVHVVTVNDYLSKRDCHSLAPLFEFHGISIKCIEDTKPGSPERRKAYQADITYGTNSEFGFDYLRDNMTTDKDELMQRSHHYAIVDEVDSVLIDDARTPLIISGPSNEDSTQEFIDYNPKVKAIYEAQKKIVSQCLLEAKEKLSQDPTDEDGGLALFRAYRGLPKYKPLIKFLSEPGIKNFMAKIENYYMEDNNRLMPEVDELLYFSIDEHYNIAELTEKGIDFISNISEDPNFFIVPDTGEQIAKIMKNHHLSDQEKEDEKAKIYSDYSIKTKRLHIVKQLLKAYTLFEKDVDYVVMDDKVLIVDEQTGRILDGRRYSDGLHQALETKEGVKIEKATQVFAKITLQNYFRLYHKLSGMTGTAETEASEFMDIYKLDVVVTPTNKPIIRDDKQDLVYKTARAKYNAVIDQIVELSSIGRPVLVGTMSVDISELLSRMLKLRGIKHQVLNAKYHQQEAEIIAKAGEKGTVTIATNMAGRGTDIKLTEESRALGGLAIIGTERHESRRVDRQLRGRSGRQGDVGSSQFFVSFEDNLMRLAFSTKIQRLIDAIDEDEVIQDKLVTKLIEHSQKKVEQNNYGIRKRLLEYDNILNKQREIIYNKRKNSLINNTVFADTFNIFFYVTKNYIVNGSDDNIPVHKDICNRFQKVTGFALDLTEEQYNSMSLKQLNLAVYKQITDIYMAKCELLKITIENKYSNIFEEYNEYSFSFTHDGVSLSTDVNIDKLQNGHYGKVVLLHLSNTVVVHYIDIYWQKHLVAMDELRQLVQNSSYEQKDPLLVFKFESFDIFIEMMINLCVSVTQYLIQCSLVTDADTNDDESNNEENDDEIKSIDKDGDIDIKRMSKFLSQMRDKLNIEIQ